ncbi:MAG: hypothetical protein ACHQAZ_05500 [Gammaproteobacteria bacterium]
MPKSSSVIVFMISKLTVFALTLSLLVSACGAAPATAGVPISAKIAPAVSDAISRLESGQPLEGRVARTDSDGRLEVYVHMTNMSADSLAALAAHGLKRPTPSPAMGLVQGWIAPQDVTALAALTVVSRITLPQYVIHG